MAACDQHTALPADGADNYGGPQVPTFLPSYVPRRVSLTRGDVLRQARSHTCASSFPIKQRRTPDVHPRQADMLVAYAPRLVVRREPIHNYVSVTVFVRLDRILTIDEPPHSTNNDPRRETFTRQQGIDTLLIECAFC